MARRMAPGPPALSVVVELPAEKQLELLGGFGVSLVGERQTLSANTQRLVAFLGLNERPISRFRVAATLWPETTEARAAASLRSALWRIRQITPWLVDVRDDLQIAADVEVDIREARRLAQQVRDPVSANESAELEPFLVDLLPDWYEDWVIGERERYRQVRLHALESFCDLLVAKGRYAKAIEAGLGAVAGEPLRESGHRALIRAHIAEGNLGEALRQYRIYRALLQEELGVEPSGELTRLVGALIT